MNRFNLGRLGSIIGLVLALWLLGSDCSKPNITHKYDFSDGLLILNQGNFTYANASLTYFDLKNASTLQNVFAQVNGFKLGDVAQSAIAIDTLIFLIVNNSGKIYALSDNTLQVVGLISGLASPRYMQPIDDSLAVVTDLYSKPWIVNYRNFTVKSQINLSYSTEAILLWQEYLFMSNWSYGKRIFRINLNTWEIDTLTINYQPNSMVIDRYQRLWVLCDGGLWEGADTLTRPSLEVIDPAQFQVLYSLQFDSVNISPMDLNINSSQDTLYFLVSAWQPTSNPHFGVYRMSIDDTLLPTAPFIPQANATFYALDYLEPEQWLAVCDAKDFVSDGNVLIFNRKGELIYEIQAGIIPGFVLRKRY